MMSHNHSILVIEDDEALNEQLRLALESRSHDVLTARTGAEGLRCVVTIRPDLVILDLSLPDISGSSVLQVIRADRSLVDIPVIVMTGLTEPGLSPELLELGADQFLTKPFSLRELHAIVERRLLVKKHTAVQAARTLQAATAAHETDEQFLRRFMLWIEMHHHDASLGVSDIAAALGISRTALYMRLQAAPGLSFLEILTRYRLTRARDLLSTGMLGVADTAWAVGYHKASYFSRLFKERYGHTPRQFVQQAADERRGGMAHGDVADFLQNLLKRE